MSTLSPQAQMIRETLSMGLSGEDMRARIGEIPQHIHNEVRTALNNDRDRLNFKTGVLGEIIDLLSVDKLVLQKNMHSRAHKIYEASQNNKILNLSGEVVEGSDELTEGMISTAQIFVVQHDWAAAISHSIESNEDVNLPFINCIFEFMLNGKYVIVFAAQPEGEQPKALSFVSTSKGWVCIEDYTDNDSEGVLWFVWQQIVAICVALDAEVATTEVIRAPSALNKKREAKGKPPLKDFHIVDLSRRHRVAGPGSGTHRSPRLHFRRGHWRHLDGYKTWIKWMLVGDPDLGFIEKQYKI